MNERGEEKARNDGCVAGPENKQTRPRSRAGGSGGRGPGKKKNLEPDRLPDMFDHVENSVSEGF